MAHSNVKKEDVENTFRHHYPQNNVPDTREQIGDRGVFHPVTVVDQPARPHPSSFMWLSGLSCCFCWPMAICACAFSIMSSAAAKRGDYNCAKAYGLTAMGIAIVAIVIGIALIVVIFKVNRNSSTNDSYNYY